jgi:tetratricopeptide (TPR) repeat protein
LPDTPASTAIDLPPGEPDELEVYQREFAACPAEERKRAALLLYEMGRRWRQRQNLPNAAQCFLKAYTLAPEFRPVVREARRIYRDRGDFRLVVKLLDAEARATRPGAERASLLREKGRILEEHQADRAGAEASYRAALAEDEHDLAALAALDRLLTRAGDAAAAREVMQRIIALTSDEELRGALWRDIAHLEIERGDPDAAQAALAKALELSPGHDTVLADLERLYAGRSAWPELVRTLDQRLAALPDGERAAALETRIARLLRDRTLQLPEAADRFKRALERDPDDYLSTTEYQHLCEELARWPEVAWALDRRAMLVDDKALRAGLYHRLGVVRQRYLSDDAGAVEALLASVKEVPTHVPALEALGRLLASRGEWQTLVETHLAEIEALSDAPRRTTRLFKAAEILERRIGDEVALAKAISLYTRALEETPGYLPAVLALERLLAQTGRFSDLQALYEREVERAPAVMRPHLYESMGRIWAERLGDLDKAIDCFERLLETEPENVAGLRELARLYAKAWKWKELIECNERELPLLSDARRKVDLLVRTGELWEDRLLDLQKAAHCYQRALELAPGFLPALKALGRIYRQRARWEELIQMHRDEAALTESPEQMTFLLYAIAEIFDDELMRPDDAARTYREILERVPGYLPALTSLESLYEERRAFSELVTLREASLEALSDDRSKALLLAQIGALREERLDDAAGAANDYARALRLLPELSPAHASLVQMYELEGEHAKLADLYARGLEHAQSPHERAALGERLGELWDRHLAGPRKAATYFETALEQGGENVGMLHALAAVYRRLGMARELERTYERTAKAVGDPAAAAAYQLRAAELREEHQPALGDPVQVYARALELSPDNAGVQRALERTLRDGARPRELARILSVRLAAARDTAERAAMLVEMGESHEAAGDLAAAEKAFSDARVADPSSLPALWGLARICESGERWQERAELAVAEAGALGDPGGQAAALMLAADLWHDKLARRDLAAPLYKQVLEIDPGHDRAFDRLRALLLESEDWNPLVDLLRNRTGAIGDPQEIARRLGEMADIYIKRLDQPRKGMSCLRKALEVDPYDKKALVELARMYDQQQQWNKALALYGRAAGVVEDAQARRTMELRAAELWEKLGDSAQALGAYRRVLARLPNDEETLERASDLAEDVGDFPLAARALEQRADLSDDPVKRVALRKRLAALCEERLDEPERAIKALAAALAEAPLDPQSVEKLSALYGRMGDRDALSRHLAHSIQAFRAAALAQPFSTEAITALSRIYRWGKHYDGLLACFSILAYLGATDTSIRNFLSEAMTRRPHAVDPVHLSNLYEHKLLPPAARGAARDLLRLVAPALLGVDPKELVRRGLVAGEPLRPETTLAMAIGDIARACGVPEVQIWLASSDPRACHAYLTTPPSLVVGAEVAALPIAVKHRFRLARTMFLIREAQWGAAGLIGPTELALALAAGIREGLDALPPGTTATEREPIEAEARRLRKAMPRREREQLRGVAKAFLDRAAHFDPRLHVAAVHSAAVRSALLVCGDAEASLGETSAEFSARSNEVVDLVRFILSDEYQTLRKEFGWA